MLDIRATNGGAAGPPPNIEIKYYPYDASQPAAGVFAALFFIGFVVSMWQTIRHKAWIWMIMNLAILMEAIGYAARVYSAGHPTGRAIYIVQFCLIILAPVFMAGIIYVVFGRIVFHVVPPKARTIGLLWVPARWLTPIFVGFDIFALFLQLVGAVVISGTQVTDADAATKLQRGKDIALAGVTTQIVAFGLFSFVAFRFHFTSKQFKAQLESRYQTTPGDKFVTIQGRAQKFKPNWRGMLYAVNATCAFILIRSVYREVDFSLGKNGYTSDHEWCLYVFDSAPMFLVVLLYTLFPPGAYVLMGWRQPKSEEAQDYEPYSVALPGYSAQSSQRGLGQPGTSYEHEGSRGSAV